MSRLPGSGPSRPACHPVPPFSPSAARLRRRHHLAWEPGGAPHRRVWRRGWHLDIQVEPYLSRRYDAGVEPQYRFELKLRGDPRLQALLGVRVVARRAVGTGQRGRRGPPPGAPKGAQRVEPEEGPAASRGAAGGGPAHLLRPGRTLGSVAGPRGLAQGHGPERLHRQRAGRPVAGQGAEQGVALSANTWAKHRGE
jgi:hypothetical protein